MDNNQFQNQNDNNQYLSMVNYLISQLNKAKVNPFPVKNQPSPIPIFLYEFFVFELYLPRELLKFIKQPILAFRLLDFPTLTLEGNLNIQRQSVIFNQGKSSFFEMELLDLKDNLLNQPMYIMFLDLNHGNIKIMGNCRLNISLFAYDSFLNYGNGPIPDPRRNILQLYDSTMEKVGEFEMSLIIRREYYKFDKNIEVTENKKAVLIKKAKKPRQILSKDKREDLMYKGKERPKLQKEIVYDNNKISNSKYMKPQFVNNIIIEKNDTAFNAHPVNKEIIIKQKDEEQQKSPEKIGENKKKKKGKVMKCNAQTETDLIPGANIPINNVDYNKKNVKKKKVISNNNFNDINYYKNNQMLINSMYNKYQSDAKYNFPQYELRPKNYNNNNYPNSNNFNNYYNNQNNINQNSNYETQSSQKNEYKNTYLKFLTNLKSQINDYTNNLINDKKIIQKVKYERNLNQQSGVEINMNNNINDNNDINSLNNKIEDFKKPEKIEKSENKENSEIKEESKDDDNNKNDNNNKNEIKNNIENNNNINNFNEKKEKVIISEESKEDEEYNDFVKSEKSNISNNKKNTDELLDNKFNNFNSDFEEKKVGEIQENINNNDNINNINNNNNNIPSDNEIKEDSSLEENKNNGNQIESGEINEEIDDNLISTKKQIKTSNNNIDINSASENKGLASSSTEKIENLLK